MKAVILESLTHKYTEKANYHGYEAILGHSKFKKYHKRMEKYYDQLLISVAEKYLNDYARRSK